MKKRPVEGRRGEGRKRGGRGEKRGGRGNEERRKGNKVDNNVI